MKFLLILVSMAFINSCNTTIGVWRDTKAAGNWTKQKFQDASNGGSGGQDYEYGAPVY